MMDLFIFLLFCLARANVISKPVDASNICILGLMFLRSMFLVFKAYKNILDNCLTRNCENKSVA